MRGVLLAAVVAAGCASSSGDEPPTALSGSSTTQAVAPDQTIELKPGISMDVYRPKAGAGPFPAVLLLHGGGWRGGGKAEMAGVARIFAEEGLVAVTSSYRFAPQHVWPAQGEDVAAAIARIRADAATLNVRPEKVGAAGVSAGGHLSAYLGVGAPSLKPNERVQAVGSISGIHDLAAPMTPAGDAYRIIETLLGETTARDAAKRRDGSPTSFVDAKAAPMMFVVGGKDPLVPRSQSELMEKRLKSVGVEATILDVPEMGHVPNVDQPADAEAMRKLARWMKAKLG